MEMGRPPWLGLLILLVLALAPAGFRFEFTGELARIVRLPLVPFQWAGMQLESAVRGVQPPTLEQEEFELHEALIEARRERDVSLAQTQRLQITLDALRDRLRRAGEIDSDVMAQARRVRADVIDRNAGFVRLQLERRWPTALLLQSVAVSGGTLVGWTSPEGARDESSVVNLLPVTASNAPKILALVRLESGRERTVKLSPRDGELVGYLEIDLAPYTGEPVRLLPSPGIPDVAVGLSLGRLVSAEPAPQNGVRLREIKIKPQPLPEVRAELLVPLGPGEGP